MIVLNLSPIFIYFLVFVFGTIWGSFFNVCIYRIPRGESIISPPSHCPKCGKKIKWYDNIPILSYIFLRGKCRYCKNPISPQYAIVEFITGVLFAYTYVVYGLSYLFLFYCIVISLLLIGSVIDLKYLILPDFTTVGGFIFVFFSHFLFDLLNLSIPLFSIQRDFFISLSELLSLKISFLTSSSHYIIIYTFLGAFLGFLFFVILAIIGKIVFKREAMGGGDIKLITFLGALCGPIGVFLVIFISSLLGSIVGIILYSLGRKRTKGAEETIWNDEDFSFLEEGYYVPYGPFLALAGIIVIFWGKEFFMLYLGA